MEDKSSVQKVLSPYAVSIISVVLIFFLYQIGGLILLMIPMSISMALPGGQTIRIITAIGQLLFLLLPALLITKVYYGDIKSALKIKAPKLTHLLYFSIGLSILVGINQYYIYIQNFIFDFLAEKIVFINYLKSLLTQLDKLVEESYKLIMSYNNSYHLVTLIVVISIIPALAEEVLFRGLIQKGFEVTTKPVYAALITAVFFSLFHMSPYGIIPLAALGFYFGYAAYKTQSLIIPMILHFLNNFVSVMIYVYSDDPSSVSASVRPSGDNIYMEILSFVLLIILFFGYNALGRKYILTTKTTGGRDDMPEM